MIGMKTDTIAAIATGLSNAGISIIRVSGEEAVEVVGKLVRSKSGEYFLSSMGSHTVRYGYIYENDVLIDEVMVLYMKGPKSYTREDIVEIDCHGGIVVTKRILEAIIHQGARLAEPGEFTKRAFLNGRIDLSQAEAVIDLIQAKNELAAQNSVHQLKGAVLNKIKEIRESVLLDVAYIEAALDDPEHISLEGFREQLLERVNENKGKLEKLLYSADHGRILKEGIQTVILGKPNAGKSSLMNLFVKEERAIVTEIAGTTRDTIEESIQLNGISLNIIDTAGIRKTEDIVEKIGVEKARKLAEEADLILYVTDASIPLDENDMEIISSLSDKKAIILLNKSDLIPIVEEKELKQLTDKTIIRFSAKEQKGMEELEEKITSMFFKGELSFNDEIYITSVRHKEALYEALESLRQVLNSIEAEMPEDFYSIDLMNCYEVLGRIIGESVDEDLINTIFKEFCMGK